MVTRPKISNKRAEGEKEELKRGKMKATTPILTTEKTTFGDALWSNLMARK